MAESDPLSALPLEFYGEIPIVKSMAIQTPAGLQPVHFHYGPGMKVVRLFRPEGDNYWFDFDQVGNYLWKKSEKLQKEIERWRMANPSEIAVPPFWFIRLVTYALSPISRKAREKANIWELYIKETRASDLHVALIKNCDLIKSLTTALDTGL